MLAMLGAEITGICAQNQGNAISEDPKFKNFPGEHAPDPPGKERHRSSIVNRESHIH